MNTYATHTTTAVNFVHSAYPAGTGVTVCSALVHDGVCLVRFPQGEETYVAAWRLWNPPARATTNESTVA
jgi:hypothetical protein